MFQAIIKALGLVKDFKAANLCYGKRWWLSKTLWVNGIALIGIVLQWYFKRVVLPPEVQTSIIIILNVLLRFDTAQPLVAKESDIVCNPVTNNIGEVVAYLPVIDNPSGASSEE